jgi:hypothetical protein
MTGTGGAPEPFVAAEEASDNLRIEFIKNELAMCFTFSVLASIKYEAGDHDLARQSLDHAEEAYAAAAPLVSRPEHSKYLTGAVIREFTRELDRLRERLDELHRL